MNSERNSASVSAKVKKTASISKNHQRILNRSTANIATCSGMSLYRSFVFSEPEISSHADRIARRKERRFMKDVEFATNCVFQERDLIDDWLKRAKCKMARIKSSARQQISGLCASVYSERGL
jgi:hypothetical protein